MLPVHVEKAIELACLQQFAAGGKATVAVAAAIAVRKRALRVGGESLK